MALSGIHTRLETLPPPEFDAECLDDEPLGPKNDGTRPVSRKTADALIHKRTIYKYSDRGSFSRVLDSDSLLFNSHFESGNLNEAFRYYSLSGSGTNEYEIKLNHDVHTVGHVQWFCFSVRNTFVDIPIRFNIGTFYKGDSMYNEGMKVLMYSKKLKDETGVGWRRIGNDINYYCTGTKAYTLSFNFKFPYAKDTTYFSYCFPYSYTRLQRFLGHLGEDPETSKTFTREVLCPTLAGNKCELLRITNGDDDKASPSTKRTLMLTARVHPGESNSSWIMEGALRFLTSSNPEAVQLRRHFVILVVPMVNPDGVINGNYRCSLAGVDLNRRWLKPDECLHPTVFNIKKLIATTNQTSTVLSFVDLHGHSRKAGAFMYGCDPKTDCRFDDGIAAPTVHDDSVSKLTAELDSSAPKRPARVLPWVLGCLNPHFSFPDCAFSVSKQKESTARVVIWRDSHVLNTFTLEASLCGPPGGHFSTKDLKRMGSDLCRAWAVYFQLPVPSSLLLGGNLFKEWPSAGRRIEELCNLQRAESQKRHSWDSDNDEGSDGAPSDENLKFTDILREMKKSGLADALRRRRIAKKRKKQQLKENQQQQQLQQQIASTPNPGLKVSIPKSISRRKKTRTKSRITQPTPISQIQMNPTSSVDVSLLQPKKHRKKPPKVGIVQVGLGGSSKRRTSYNNNNSHNNNSRTSSSPSNATSASSRNTNIMPKTKFSRRLRQDRLSLQNSSRASLEPPKRSTRHASEGRPQSLPSNMSRSSHFPLANHQPTYQLEKPPLTKPQDSFSLAQYAQSHHQRHINSNTSNNNTHHHRPPLSNSTGSLNNFGAALVPTSSVPNSSDSQAQNQPPGVRFGLALAPPTGHSRSPDLGPRPPAGRNGRNYDSRRRSFSDTSESGTTHMNNNNHDHNHSKRPSSHIGHHHHQHSSIITDLNNVSLGGGKNHTPTGKLSKRLMTTNPLEKTLPEKSSSRWTPVRTGHSDSRTSDARPPLNSGTSGTSRNELGRANSFAHMYSSKESTLSNTNSLSAFFRRHSSNNSTNSNSSTNNNNAISSSSTPSSSSTSSSGLPQSVSASSSSTPSSNVSSPFATLHGTHPALFTPASSSSSSNPTISSNAKSLIRSSMHQKTNKRGPLIPKAPGVLSRESRLMAPH
eukprot:TRINITY_DN1000_c0_g1_i1.p1 TRINITY_DN1000_c0_g1~~TRINITY_DN1000_c0_g1_i1.p1  ORF type:complete len:1145 (+),score=261.99 TRINITY_DN1000_c0_g1_i1:119-3553(+)